MVASMGVYPKAERYFKQALVQLKVVDAHLTLPAWEPVYNNLGHVLRKQGKHEEALGCHFNSLQLGPRNSSTLSAIAFLYLLQGQLDLVFEYANQSLQVRRDDQFTLEVLHNAVMEANEAGTGGVYLPLSTLGPIPDVQFMDDELEPKVRMILKPLGVKGDSKTVEGVESECVEEEMNTS